MSEKTFSLQDSLPSLTIPTLDETLDRYLESATVLLTPEETAKTRKAVDECRKSKQVELMQKALEDRAKTQRNWLEDWWYDAYLEVRLPLVPFISFATIITADLRTSKREVQILTASEAAHHMMKIWQKNRREQIPIMKSRGVAWDMNQNYVMFNSNRTPAKPKDRLDRHFKTESEGTCPSHIIVLCRGSIWKVEMEIEGEIRSPDDTVRIFRHIQHESTQLTHSPITLTTTNRDEWTDAREELTGVCRNNERNLKMIEESAFVLTLSDDECPLEEEALRYAMMGRSDMAWVDKCMNIILMTDSQILIQGEHSNLDGMVVLDAGTTMATVMRKGEWKVEKTAWHSDFPKRLNFELTQSLVTKIDMANSQFEKMKHTFRVKVVRFNEYGNDRLKRKKIYTDTVVQIALQLAFFRVHGSFGPIYETASTRKFYHGRTETVRGLTRAMKEFGEGLRDGKEETELLRLFKKAYEAHNQLMADATIGKGVDRHLYGLRKSLQSMNSEGNCQSELLLPTLFTDEGWKKSGGDGNFLLSTSFNGYADGMYGYACAMKKDGYGTFYLTQPNQIVLTITDYVDTKSDLDAYGKEIEWSLNRLEKIIDTIE
ncbi:hypothetical protein PENTCL1PPCAC_15683, partial [Pristionchus entomophagus]